MSGVKRLPVDRLDALAIKNAIERSPFNPHEKSVVATHRRILALAYQDGYRDCEERTEAQVRELVEALAALHDSYVKVCPFANMVAQQAREVLSQFRGDA